MRVLDGNVNLELTAILCRYKNNHDRLKLQRIGTRPQKTVLETSGHIPGWSETK